MTEAGGRGALAGVTVVETGCGVAVAFCGKLLADFGATVIKIEHPAKQDPIRTPLDEGGSGLDMFLNTNKQSVTLDIESDAGRQLFYRLLSTAGVLTTFAEGPDLASATAIFQDLRTRQPDLVQVALSWLGLTGPWSGFACNDFLAQHMSGMAFSTAVRMDDPPAQPPLATQGHLGEMAAGLTAATAATVALFGRELDGAGELIDIAVVEALTSFLRQEVVTLTYGVGLMSRKKQAVSRFAGVFKQPTQDGFVDIMIRTEAGWRALIELIGNPEWAESEAFATHPQRSLYWDAIEPLLQADLSRYTKDHVHMEGQRRGIAVSALNTVAGALASPQFRERDFFATARRPSGGDVLVPGGVFRLADLPRPSRPAPSRGADTHLVLSGLGCTTGELHALAAQGVI